MMLTDICPVPKEFWNRLSVGECKKCNEAHSLVDGLCWDCRKKKSTEVLDLATGRTLVYDLPPEEAVKAAYLQSKGDWNTWGYGKKEVPLVYGKHTVTRGEFTAMRGDV